VATVARLLPRYWDGRRLLQFVTGLALIALAFAVPALLGPADQPAEAPVTVITTVDTPLSPVLPVIDGPDGAAAGNQTGLALGTEAAEAAGSAEAAGTAAADAGTADAAGSAETAEGTVTGAGNAAGGEGDPQGAAPIDSSVVQGPAGLPVQGRSGGRICVEARAAVGGSAQRAHRDRGPPRA
jgi:hypothetical protein